MIPLFEQFPIVISQEVIWGDMDAFDHVNNTVYFRYFEDVRIAYFNKLGVREYMEKSNIGPILASTTCNFRQPLKYPDRIHIGGRSTILSPKKFQMDYVVVSESLDRVVAEGQGLLVYYDYSTGKSCQIPDQIMATMKRLNTH